LRRFAQFFFRPHAVFQEQEFLHKRPAHGVCQSQPCKLRARIVHADDAPSRVQHGDEGGNRIQCCGDKDPLDRQRALGALPLPLCLLLHPHAVVEFEPRNSLAAQNLEQSQMF
jgi:hypothetical protein